MGLGVLLVVLCLVQQEGAPADTWPADLPVLRVGDVVRGVIEDGDPVVETEVLQVGEYLEQHAVLGRTWRLAVDEPGTYHVDLRSHFFDAYLVVRDERGMVVAEDDDGWVRVHSRVVLQMSPERPLWVQACALHGQRGTLALSLRAGGQVSLSGPDRRRAEDEDDQDRLRELASLFGSDSLEVAEALNSIGGAYQAAGRYQEARPALARALSIREAALGTDHLDVATSLNDLALLLHVLGDPEGARPLYDRSLAILEGVLGPDHPDVAQSLNNIAYLLEDMGAPGEALPLYERALSIREAALGPDHPDVGLSLNNLASVLYSQGAVDKARRLFERSLAIQEAALGPNHPDVATALNNLAFMLEVQGAFGEARPLYERSLLISEAVLGANHPDVARSLGNLAGLAQDQGDFGAAQPLYERALAIQEAAFGPDHRDVARCLSNLASLLVDQGAYAEARPLMERSLSIREAALGPTHPDVATGLGNLGGLLQDVGAYDEARPLYERSLAIRVAAVPPNLRDVALSLNNLASLLSAQGAYDDAVRLYERSLTILEAARGPDHPDVAMGLNNLASVLDDLGRHDEGRRLYERSLSIQEAALGPAHPDVALSLNNLAILLYAQGSYDEALPLQERALSIWEEVLGPDHRMVALSLNNLATLRDALGQPGEARPLLERALSIQEAVLGLDHPDVAVSRLNLAIMLVNLGETGEAEGLLRRSVSGERRHRQELLGHLTSSESYLYLAKIRWQLELRLSPVLATLRASAYEHLLEWKGQVLRATGRTDDALRGARSTKQLAHLERLGVIASLLSRNSTSHALGGEVLDEAASRRLAALIRERQRLERELWEAHGTTALEDSGWTALRDALPSSSALVDVFVCREYRPASWNDGELLEGGSWTVPKVTAWVTRFDGEQPVRVDLGPAIEVESAVKTLILELVGHRGSSLVDQTDPNESVRQLVWEPIARHLEGLTTVFVSPDGVLATFPFEVLRDESGRYLIEDRRFVYLTDATRLTDIAKEEPVKAVGRVMAAGGIDYWLATDEGGASLMAGDVAHSATQIATALAEVSGPRGVWSDVWRELPSTLDEVGQLSARHRKAHPTGERNVLTGATATEKAIKAAMPGANVIHLATHGYFNPDGLPSLADAAARAEEASRGQPWQESFYDIARKLEGYAPGLLSGLVFAGVNGELPEGDDDGYLTAEEIGWLDLSACDLVVLSACDTGLGRPQSGEGLLGLRRAFQVAGAKTVISSLWPVGDRSTALLMDLFYGNLWQKGMGKHEALRAAQLELLQRSRARDGDGSPEAWGAFVLDGDWR